MNLSQRQLRMFVTTAAFAHVTRASAALHITQPALTRALREFEGQLAVRLFDRTTRRLALTPEGEAFLPVAQRLLADMERAVGDLRLHGEGAAPLVVGTGVAFGATLLPAAVALFAQAHPGVPVRIVTGSSGALTRQVATGDLDLAIASPVGDTAALRAQAILSAALGVAGTTALGASVTPAKLAGLPLLKDASDSSITQLLREHGPDLVARLRHGVEVSDLSVQLALARSGLGLALVSGLAAMHPQARGLVFTPLRPAIRREWCLLFRRDARPAAAAGQFADAVRRACASAPLHRAVRVPRRP